jgi:hypothetical protein
MENSCRKRRNTISVLCYGDLHCLAMIINSSSVGFGPWLWWPSFRIDLISSQTTGASYVLLVDLITNNRSRSHVTGLSSEHISVSFKKDDEHYLGLGEEEILYRWSWVWPCTRRIAKRPCMGPPAGPPVLLFHFLL